MKVIEKAIKELLDQRPFYAHFFLNCKVIYNDPKIPTAAAAIVAGAPVLYFNEEFLSQFTTKECAAVVEHEIMHMMFEHVYLFADRSLDLNRYTCNIAMDCAINQFIPELPKIGITPEKVEEFVGYPLERFQTWEYYYAHIKDQADKMKQNGVETLDVHDGDLGDGTGDGKGIGQDQQKAILKSAVDKAASAANGNIPEHVQKIISALSQAHQVNWKQTLRLFVAKSTSSSFKATRKKLNRRFGLDMPGKNKKHELTLGVCVDSSGSVSDAAYEQFMAEIVDISKHTLKTYLVDADCVVQNVTTIKKGAKFSLERHGGGGTAYQPAISECLRLKCDAIIYFGDFDTSDTPNNPGVPFLWVGVGTSPKPGAFGAEIRLK